MAKQVSKQVAHELGKAYSQQQAKEQASEYNRGLVKGAEGYRNQDHRKYGYYNGLYFEGEFFARGYVDGWHNAHIENGGTL